MVHNFSPVELAQSVEEVEARFIAASKKIADYHALSQTHISDAQEMHRMEYLLKLVKTQAAKHPKKVVAGADAGESASKKVVKTKKQKAAELMAKKPSEADDFDLDDNQGDNF